MSDETTRLVPFKVDHYFSEGRCSGHDQFNGRYCREAAGPEQWCIHCAGFMLLQALRESARLEQIAREFVAYWLRDGGCGMCGGVPHSTTCFVGRMEQTLTLPEAATAEAPAKDGDETYEHCESCNKPLMDVTDCFRTSDDVPLCEGCFNELVNSSAATAEAKETR